MAKEILVADSDKADQAEFQKIFETTDYHLVFSESGEDVLLRVKLFKPDLIIAGRGLKGKNTLELCEAIKTGPESKHIPVILLSTIFDEISEKDRKRVHADGVISEPLHEGEVLNLVDRLLEEEAIREEEEGISERETEWKSLADIGGATPKEEFMMDSLGDMEEEEIIELVDVVEEPEPRMSINDFVAPEKEEPFREVPPLESWKELGEEEKPFKEGLILAPEEKDEEAERIPPRLEKEVISEEDFFEKIELEEILERVEQMKPSIEKEWPGEKEARVSEEPSMGEEPAEEYLGLKEFEAALQHEVKTEPPEEELQPLFIEEPKVEVPIEVTPVEMALEEEVLEGLSEEEFPEELLEELEEEEIGLIEEPKEEPEEERIEIFEGLEAPKVPEEEIGFIEEPKEITPEEIRPEEEKIEKLEEVKIPRIFEEEVSPLLTRVDRQMEEVIAKGVQEMIENFITNIIPEMTQGILTLTMERIEKMIREILPDLAEKAIQDEIKRLKKGEKD